MIGASSRAYRSVCQFTGKKATDRQLPRASGVASAHQQCRLSRHEQGRRVAFTQWDTSRGAMETITGFVLAHVDRTITVRTDDGREIWTSCGHVVAAR